jgi:hypothetical protein
MRRARKHAALISWLGFRLARQKEYTAVRRLAYGVSLEISCGVCNRPVPR